MIRKLRKTERSEAERTHDRAAGWATDRAIEMDLVGVGSRSAHDLARDREMAALECEWLAAQSQLDDPPTLLEAGARLAHVDAVGVILQLRGAAPNPQMQFAVRESVEHQDLFSDAHRIVQREHQHRRSEAEFEHGRASWREKGGKNG